MGKNKRIILNVSGNIPDLPQELVEEGGVTIKKIEKLKPFKKASGELEAFFLDVDFINKNAETINSMGLLPASILVWNPEGEWKEFTDKIDTEVVCQEVFSIENKNYFLATVRNMFRTLFLEKELRRKEKILQEKENQNKELLSIGLALSAERDNEKLLQLILQKSREIINADAGSIYQIINKEDSEEKVLLFKIAQNDSNPTDYTEFTMPINKKSIAGYVASTGLALNIPDVYEIDESEEYSFNKSYDKATGYRTKSVLTVPMKDHKEEIIWVIQLINKKKRKTLLKKREDFEKYVIPFTKRCESIVYSLASQAAVSLENNLLYQEIETLFEGFVMASVKAIEQRDPSTSGHSYRVASYTVALAKAVERTDSGAYRNVVFTPEQIKEIRYAGLLHDFGKVGVREHVLVKAKKLYPHQLEIINMRFAYVQKAIELYFMQKRFELLKSEGEAGYKRRASEIDEEEKQSIRELKNFLDVIQEANEPTLLSGRVSSVIDKIAEYVYTDIGGNIKPLLTEDEKVKLKIKRGSLDDEERKEIESHVTHTYLFLKTIPWTREMKNVPEIAYCHHEKLNGEGYPRGIKGDEIPIQARMMTIADIFDALTARDRPYKRAVPTEKALNILTYEIESNHVDPDLVKIFIEAKVFEEQDRLLKG